MNDYTNIYNSVIIIELNEVLISTHSEYDDEFKDTFSVSELSDIVHIILYASLTHRDTIPPGYFDNPEYNFDIVYDDVMYTIHECYPDFDYVSGGVYNILTYLIEAIMKYLKKYNLPKVNYTVDKLMFEDFTYKLTPIN